MFTERWFSCTIPLLLKHAYYNLMININKNSNKYLRFIFKVSKVLPVPCFLPFVLYTAPMLTRIMSLSAYKEEASHQ